MNKVLIFLSIVGLCLIGAVSCQHQDGVDRAWELKSKEIQKELDVCPCDPCVCDPCRCNCPCGPNCDCDPCRCNEKAEVKRPKVVVLYFYADW